MSLLCLVRYLHALVFLNAKTCLWQTKSIRQPVEKEMFFLILKCEEAAFGIPLVDKISLPIAHCVLWGKSKTIGGLVMLAIRFCAVIVISPCTVALDPN